MDPEDAEVEMAAARERERRRQSAINREHCPEALRHDSGPDGRCRWCKRKVDLPSPRPNMEHGRPAEIDIAYGLQWDPDYPYTEKRYDE